MTIDIEHLRGWVGQSESASELVTASVVERFNATFDRVSSLDNGAEAPLLIHLCLAQPAAANAILGPEGHPTRGGFLPPVPLPRRMWAGGSFTFAGPIRIGETVTRTSKVAAVDVKQGRSGLLCFVKVEHTVTSNGVHALTEIQNIVYRGGETAGQPAAAPPAAPAGTHSHTITPTAPYLFRYSALTFNAHRIHYDLPYTRDEEGYPGLLVHGPLQATLLVQLAADVKGAPPSRFTFTSLAPIFDIADFTINAEADGTGFRLWTAQVGGPVAMEAKADW